MLTNQINYNFKLLWDAPIDDRFKIESVSDVINIPLEVRYTGLLIWVNNLNRFFVFKNGINDSNFEVFSQNDILIIDDISYIPSIPMQVRYQGLMVFIKSAEDLYVFRKGINDADLIPLNNDIIIINSHLDIPDIPDYKRYHGRLFYVMETNELFSFINPLGNVDIKLVNASNIQYHIIDSVNNFSGINVDRLKDGALIYALDTKLLYILDGGIEFSNLKVFQNAVTVESSDDLVNITIKHHGMLVWVDGLNRYFKWDELLDEWVNIYQDSIIVDSEIEEQIIINSGVFRPQFIIKTYDNSILYFNGVEYVPLTGYVITNLTELSSITYKKDGALVWVKSLSRYFRYNGLTNKWENIYQDSIIVASAAEMDVIAADSIFKPQFIIQKDTSSVFFYDGEKYLPVSILTIDTIVGLQLITNKFDGMMVYVTQVGKLFRYSKTADKWNNVYQDSIIVSDVSKVNEIISDGIFRPQFIIQKDTSSVFFYDGEKYLPLTGYVITNLTELSSITYKKDGALVWVKSLSRYFRYNGLTNKWENIYQDSIIVASAAEMDVIAADSIFKPQFIIQKDTSSVFFYDGEKYLPVSILTIDTITNMQLMTNKFGGMMVYVTQVGKLFRYNKAKDTWDNVYQDSIIVSDVLKVNEIISDGIFRPQFIIQKDTSSVFFYDGEKYLPLTGYVITNLTELSSITYKKDGALVWVKSLSRYFRYNGLTNKWENIYQDSIIVASAAEMDVIAANSIFKPQFIIQKDTSSVFFYDGEKYLPVSILTIDTITNMQLIINKFDGIMVYVTQVGKLFRYNKAKDTWDNVYQDSIVVSDASKVNEIGSNSIFKPQFIIQKDTSSVFFYDGEKYLPITTLTIDTIAGLQLITNKFDGMMVYVTQVGKLFRYSKTANKWNNVYQDSIIVSDVSKVNEIISGGIFKPQFIIQSDNGNIWYYDGIMYRRMNEIIVDDLDDLMPIPDKYDGMLVWVNSIGKHFRYDADSNKWDNVYQDSVSVANEQEFNSILSSTRFKPRFIIREDTKETYFYTTNDNKYNLSTKGSIPIYATIDELNSQPSEDRVIGRIYFITQSNQHYTYTKSNSPEHLQPINITKNVSTIDNLDTDFPVTERNVGDLFIDVTTSLLYYFVTKSTYKRFAVLSEFSISTQLEPNISKKISHNLMSEFLQIIIYDEDGDKVNIDWEYDNANSMNNIVLTSAVGGTYNINIKSY